MTTPVCPEDFQNPETKIPILVQLGLTYRCNLKCSHCYALYRRNRDEFTLVEIQTLARELHEAGSAAVVYSHGENMIRPDFYEAAQEFRDLEFYQTLMLNGYYVRGSADSHRLFEAGIDRTMISVDGPDSQLHDQTRGRPGAFDRAMRAVDLLLDSEVPTVGFSCTIDQHNYDAVEDIVELALGRGVQAVSFMQNRYNLKQVFDRNLWRSYDNVCRRIYELIVAYRGRLDIYTHDPFMLTILDHRIDDAEARANFIGANLCNVGTSMVSIDPVGNVTGCNFIPESLGNVREEPFAEIWKRLINRYSDERDPPSGVCRSCGVLAQCMGGCKAYHYAGKYDERCGNTRFGESAPHGMPEASLTSIDPDRGAGAFLGIPRIGSRLEPQEE